MGAFLFKDLLFIFPLTSDSQQIFPKTTKEISQFLISVFHLHGGDNSSLAVTTRAIKLLLEIPATDRRPDTLPGVVSSSAALLMTV